MTATAPVPPPFPLATPTPSGHVGQPQSWGKVVLLGVVTLGIYLQVWWYRNARDIHHFTGNDFGYRPKKIWLMLIPIAGPPMVASQFGATIEHLYRSRGWRSPVSGSTWCWIFLPYVGIVVYIAKTQKALNAFWQTQVLPGMQPPDTQPPVISPPVYANPPA